MLKNHQKHIVISNCTPIVTALWKIRSSESCMLHSQLEATLETLKKKEPPNRILRISQPRQNNKENESKAWVRKRMRQKQNHKLVKPLWQPVRSPVLAGLSSLLSRQCPPVSPRLPFSTLASPCADPYVFFPLRALSAIGLTCPMSQALS